MWGARLVVVVLIIASGWPASAQADDAARLNTLNSQVARLQSEGKYAQAIPLAEEAVTLTEKVHGPKHPSTAASVNNLAELYRLQGRYPEAEHLYKRALAILEEVRGPEHPDTATILNNLATLYQLQGRYAEAEPLYKRALAIQEKALGLQHPSTAFTLNNLAALYQLLGRYAEAEPLYKRALAILESALGFDDPSVATNLNNLALLYKVQGRYKEAEPLYERAIAIYEKVLGPGHSLTATGLSNLAALHRSQGRYAEAEPLYKRALTIREATLGPEHPDTATNLNNLALFYESQGRYAEAEPLYERALAIFEKTLGPEHPLTAIGFNNLALLYESQGRHAEAEPLYKRALAIREKTLGPEHPETAQSLDNLAGLYGAQGLHMKAEPLHKRAIAIREKTQGPEHPDTAQSIRLLARLYESEGRNAVAELLFERALAIQEKVLGPHHPTTITTVEDLAYLDRSQDRWSAAASRFRVTCAVRNSQGVAANDNVVCHSLLLDTLWRWSASSGSASAKNIPMPLRREAIAVSQRAGTGATSAAFARGAAQASARRSEGREIARHWEDVQSQIAALEIAFSSAAGRGGPGVAQVLANLSAERERLNADLAKTETALKAQAPDFFDLIKPEPVSVEDLQATMGEKANILRPDEAVVLLVPGHESKDKALQRESLILVVSKTKVGWAALPKTITLSELGVSFSIEKAIKSLHADMESAVKKSTRDSLVSYNLDIAHALYKALFASSEEIRTVLDDPSIKTWVIAPQGMFLSLPYASLVMDDPIGRDSSKPDALRKTKWLGIERTLTIVPSVSSLAVQRLKLNPKSAIVASRITRSEFLGFGDPDFARTGESRDTCPPASEGEGSETPVLDSAYQGVNTKAKTVRELRRIPATCREVKRLGEAFKAPKGNIVLGLSASEPGVRKHPRLSQARIIAFATHGLIAGDLQNTLAQPALAFTPPAEVQDQLPPIEDDGLLTTTDAASLDLQADWVLLSACDTAAKEGNDPDGLSGLARAFFYAGARSLLVSHWPVHDEAGMRLTTKAVELQAKDPSLTRPQAFRLSMQALMHDTSDPRFAHPAFWAPFFVVSPE